MGGGEGGYVTSSSVSFFNGSVALLGDCLFTLFVYVNFLVVWAFFLYLSGMIV